MPTQIAPPAIPTPAQSMAAFLTPPKVEGGTGEVGEVKTEVTKTPPVEPVKVAPKSPAAALGDLSDDAAVTKTPAAAPIEEPKRKDGENDSAFIKRLKAENAQLMRDREQTKADADKRLKAYDPEKLSALEKQLQEREQVIEMTAFERSKKFQTEHAKPIEKAVKTTQDFIASFTDEKGVYEKALTLKGRERMDYLREHLDTMAPSAFDKISGIEERMAARDEAITSHAENGGKWQQEQEHALMAETLKDFDAQRDTFAKKLSPLRGEQGEQYEAMARALLTGEASREDILAAPRLAVLCPYFIEQNRALLAENATLKARVEESDKFTPRLEGRGGDTSRSVADDAFAATDGKPPSIKDTARAFFRGA